MGSVYGTNYGYRVRWQSVFAQSKREVQLFLDLLLKPANLSHASLHVPWVNQTLSRKFPKHQYPSWQFRPNLLFQATLLPLRTLSSLKATPLSQSGSWHWGPCPPFSLAFVECETRFFFFPHCLSFISSKFSPPICPPLWLYSHQFA